MIGALHGRPVVFHLRSVVTLIDRECRQYHHHDAEIHHAFVLMTVWFAKEQRCQQEIMDQKQEQIDGEQSPYDQHFPPFEYLAAVAYRPHINTQQRGRKEQSPCCQVNQILLFRLFHPTHYYI